MSYPRFLIILVACLWVATATSAFGESISVGYLAYGQNFSVTDHGSNEGGGAGLFTLSYVEPVGSTFVQVTPGTIAAFCIDLKEYIYPSAPAGPNHYEIVPLAQRLLMHPDQLLWAALRPTQSVSCGANM